MNLQELIIKYLDEAKQMQLATCVGDQPWCSTVYFAHDDKHNLYWISTPERRHSKEIAVNPHVAAAIVLQHTPGDKVRGLQLQGLAREVSDHSEITELISVYSSRFNRTDLAESIISGQNPHRLYQLKPELFVLFDEVNFPDDPRQEWQVTEDL